MAKLSCYYKGFTLLELMIVIAIIGILASMSFPAYLGWVASAKVTSATNFIEPLQANIKHFYEQKQSFPKDNLIAGLPPSNKILSPHVSKVTLEDGAFHITLSKATSQSLAGKIITVRPVYVADAPKTPISWICGNTAIPQGMTAAGENKTDVSYTYLPINCRDLTGQAKEASDE